MNVHKYSAARDPRFKIVVAVQTGETVGDGLDCGDHVGVGLSIHQRVPCGFADARCAHRQHRRRPKGHDAVHISQPETR